MSDCKRELDLVNQFCVVEIRFAGTIQEIVGHIEKAAADARTDDAELEYVALRGHGTGIRAQVNEF